MAMPGLAAWQGLVEHSRLKAGQSVLVNDATGKGRSTSARRIVALHILRAQKAANRGAAGREVDYLKLIRSRRWRIATICSGQRP